LFLSFCILVQLIFNAFLITNLKQNFPILEKEIFSQTFFILSCLFILYSNLQLENCGVIPVFCNDLSTYSIKKAFTAVALSLLILLIRAFVLEKVNFFEYFSLFSFSILAFLLLISSTDLLVSYLVIELQTIAFYILASFTRSSAYSTEAGLKYFITGAFVSGFFLFGCSLIYVGLGTLNLGIIKLLLSFPFEFDLLGLNYFLLLGCALVTLTFLFKLGAVPFHFWVPDVYEGAPLTSTILFSILPKLPLFYFFIKWLGAISLAFPMLLSVIYKLGFLSILVGAYFALLSKKLMRLLIFSSISQIGFLLVSLSLLDVVSVTNLYFFLAIYIITSLLLWSQFLQLSLCQNKVQFFFNQPYKPIFISTLQNLLKLDKLGSLTLLIVLFSLAGIPPLSGFWAKVLILLNFLFTMNFADSLFLILISSFSVFYYINLIKILFFESKLPSFETSKVVVLANIRFFDCVLLTLGLFLLVFLFWFPELFLLHCETLTLTASNF